ncbi:uracil-DNA glycosylase [Glutamicibacter sp. NPDC087344]|uniref:uracil-DNA glycosylase n=1 Tax=Glutamicibacter sp. NPDC087344 TaxID=3363994 RepID=UPI00382E42CA
MDNVQPALFPAPEPDPPVRYEAADFPFFHGARYLAERGFIAQDWETVLEPLNRQLRSIAGELAQRSASGEQILPDPHVMLRALGIPAAQVRVVLIGQDPYPTPGHANGLAFAAEASVRPVPRSLANIYRELKDDVGIPPAAHADLSAWHKQGVLLLNQSLSVAAGNAGAHQQLGWSAVVEAVITALNHRENPPIALLWGKHAQKLAGLMDRMPQLTSAHPSPLSASRGFFGSRPFSEINRRLSDAGQAPINWSIPGV